MSCNFPNAVSAFAALLFLSGFSTGDAEEKKWGVYQIYNGPERFEIGLKAQIEKLGGVPDYVLFFRDMHPKRGFPLEGARICERNGATPVISKELWLWGERNGKRQDWLKAINSGQTDSYWQEWAKNAKAFGHPVILRFGFEMNGDWFGWGQQPEAFKKAWKRVHGIVRNKVNASNVQFMFSPNVEWDARQKLGAIELYYPGDDYVDLLGLDGYNFGDSHSDEHKWQSYDQVFDKSIQKMSQAPKPLIISEIGCSADPRKADWLKDFLQKASSDSRLDGFIYFNHFDPNKGEPNWLLDSDPQTLKVFREAIEAKRD